MTDDDIENLPDGYKKFTNLQWREYFSRVHNVPMKAVPRGSWCLDRFLSTSNVVRKLKVLYR